MIWRDLRPLPRVSPWNKGRRSYTWEQRRDDYAALPKEPIVITAELVTPVVHAEEMRTHLDGILSAAALSTHPVASAYDQAAVVPLPLDLVWVSPQGRPLWACTPLMPVGQGMVSREYWHKRYPSHRSDYGDKLNANTSAGRWREYRVPLQAHQIERLQALAIGNIGAIEGLLAAVTHIGKKGSMGYGRVARWSVTTGSHSLDDVLALRPVPTAYYGDRVPDGKQIALQRGWTPPYWYSPWWADCVAPA